MERIKSCGNCIYSIEIDDPGAVCCRRYPPSITRVTELAPGKINIQSHSPFVSRQWWCGEWRADDTAMSVSDIAIPFTGKPS